MEAFGREQIRESEERPLNLTISSSGAQKTAPAEEPVIGRQTTRK